VIDFHCHLDLYPNPQEIADRVQQQGIGVVSVTTTPSAWPGTRALENGRPTIRTALGLHPELAATRRAELGLFENYLADATVVGEVGLDGAREHKPTRQHQTDVFEHILSACAQAGGRILSIHSRRATSPVLEALARHPEAGVPILHWFSGSVADLQQATQLGCWFSIGPAMLAGAKGRELTSKMPRNRIVLESDGPFARVKYQPLHPWDVDAAIATLATTWALPIDVTRSHVQLNTRTLSSSLGNSTRTHRSASGLENHN
jgi:TatD DNase family protein